VPCVAFFKLPDVGGLFGDRGSLGCRCWIPDRGVSWARTKLDLMGENREDGASVRLYDPSRIASVSG
jgi:hypothetical protein